MFCANCGIEQHDGTKFCPDCGYDMANNKPTKHTIVRPYGSTPPRQIVSTDGHPYRRELFPLSGHARMIYDYIDDDEEEDEDDYVVSTSSASRSKSIASSIASLALKVFLAFFVTTVIIVIAAIVCAVLEGW